MTKYDIIAKIMAMNHIGITVLSLYPIPNCLIAPSRVYANPGFNAWKMEKRIKNKRTANDNL
jgi:hypothetical protein